MAYYGKVGNNRLVEFSARAEKAGNAYLTSDSVRNCRLSDGQRHEIRVRNHVGITSGVIADAKRGRPKKKHVELPNITCDYSNYCDESELSS